MRRLALMLTLWKRLRREGRMVWAMLRDPATPAASKVMALLALAYIVSPIDLVTDVVPLVGWLDDGLVATLLVWLSYQLLPPALREALRRRTANQGEVFEGEARRVG